ncbi:MAG: hypothetical protein QOK02_1100 [Mycobacterium sp.]|nr:hypothetical protein [Mycobacterium sp.]
MGGAPSPITTVLQISWRREMQRAPAPVRGERRFELVPPMGFEPTLPP